nr:uncharacterized protein LOC116772911 [Danaus plexippus plexippus]
MPPNTESITDIPQKHTGGWQNLHRATKNTYELPSPIHEMPWFRSYENSMSRGARKVEAIDFIQDHDWLVKIEIHQAYFHLLVAETHRRFLRVVYKEEIFQLTALLLGVSSVPRTFGTVTNWVAEILRNQGICLVVYLDDFLLANQNRNKLIAQVAETLAILKSLGRYLNVKKSMTELTHKLEYLGLVWDIQSQIIALPTRKVLSIKNSFSGLLTREKKFIKGASESTRQIKLYQPCHRGRLH